MTLSSNMLHTDKCLILIVLSACSMHLFGKFKFAFNEHIQWSVEDLMEPRSISHYFTLPIPGTGRWIVTQNHVSSKVPLLPTILIWLLSTYCSATTGPPHLPSLSRSLSYVVAGVADLPINTETLSSMTKHIRILLANTHTHTLYVCKLVCVLARPSTLAKWNGGSANNIN